jgi:hypothetical protein
MLNPRNHGLNHLLFLITCTVSIISSHARSTGSFLRNVNQAESIVAEFKPIANERLFIRQFNVSKFALMSLLATMK